MIIYTRMVDELHDILAVLQAPIWHISSYKSPVLELFF